MMAEYSINILCLMLCIQSALEFRNVRSVATVCGLGRAISSPSHCKRGEIHSVSAGLLTGEAAVLALHRLAQCPREQHSQLRASAPFTQLLALLEKQAFTLSPKVCTSSLCACLLWLGTSCFLRVHRGGVCIGTPTVQVCQVHFNSNTKDLWRCQLISPEHTSFLHKA